MFRREGIPEGRVGEGAATPCVVLGLGDGKKVGVRGVKGWSRSLR